MKLNKDKCFSCGNDRYIVNRKHTLCNACNSIRLSPAKKAAGKTTKKYTYKRKPTGEAEVFREIWEEREHICTNCKIHLGNDARAHYFAHIKPKKKHPELRLEKTNISLLCMQCHYELDMGTKESFNKRTK